MAYMACAKAAGAG